MALKGVMVAGEKLTTYEKVVRGGVAVVGAAALGAMLAETGATVHDIRKRGSDRAAVISNIRSGDYSTFVVPGYHANGHILAKNLDRHLEPLGTTHFAAHPDKGFDLDSVREEWLKARALDGHRSARIIAMSMGGLLMSHIFSDDGFRREFGPVDKLVLDSALSGSKDLSVNEKTAMGVGAVLPVTYSTNRMYHLISSGNIDGPVDFAPEVHEHEARERIGAKALIHFSAGRDQILFMRRHDVAGMSMQGFGAEIERGITYIASNDDHVVNVNRAVMIYSRQYDQDIEYRIDPLRCDSTAHAGGPERPSGLVDAILDQNHDGYLRTTVAKWIGSRL